MNFLKFLLLFLVLTSSCDLINYENGNGEINSEKRMLDSFTEIHLAGNYEIGLKQGPKSQVVIVTDNNLLKYIETEVDNGTLVIESSKRIKTDAGVKIYITYQHLVGIKSAGASIIKTENAIVSDRFNLEMPGAGLIEMEVDVSDLEITLAGAGMLKLKGKATDQIISLNGVGNLEAYELESRSCSITVSGMGGAEINVKENLDARVNGIGSIKYRGNPSTVNDNISGVGTIAPDTDQESSE